MSFPEPARPAPRPGQTAQIHRRSGQTAESSHPGRRSSVYERRDARSAPAPHPHQQKTPGRLGRKTVAQHRVMHRFSPCWRTVADSSALERLTRFDDAESPSNPKRGQVDSPYTPWFLPVIHQCPRPAGRRGTRLGRPHRSTPRRRSMLDRSALSERSQTPTIRASVKNTSVRRPYDPADRIVLKVRARS
jgi:hypothetical protein